MVAEEDYVIALSGSRMLQPATKSIVQTEPFT